MSGQRTIVYVCAAVLAVLAAPGARAQTASVSAQSRAQAIAASFNKSKHLTREKRGVRKEKYLDVRNAPAVRANPADYSGAYEAEDLGLSLELRVNSNGSVEGRGREPVDQNATVMRTFTLVGARIDGALLTGTQVYATGQRERLEGVFINRTVSQSPTDPGTTEFGLGVTGKTVRIAGGIHITKFFYRLTAGGSR